MGFINSTLNSPPYTSEQQTNHMAYTSSAGITCLLCGLDIIFQHNNPITNRSPSGVEFALIVNLFAISFRLDSQPKIYHGITAQVFKFLIVLVLCCLLFVCQHVRLICFNCQHSTYMCGEIMLSMPCQLSIQLAVALHSGWTSQPIATWL